MSDPMRGIIYGCWLGAWFWLAFIVAFALALNHC